MAAPTLADVLRPLLEAGLELDAEAARDAVWLALRRGAHASAAVAGVRDEGSAEETSADATSSLEAGPTTAPAPAPAAATAPAVREQASITGLDGTGVPLHGVRLPVAAALPQARGIARSLRPLRRRVAASAGIDLDIDATVRRAAEEDIWLPVLRARRERWLDLALVVDDSPSMAVWHDVVHELRRVLRWSGAFRTIDTWWSRGEASTVLFAGPAGTARGDRAHPHTRIAPVARRGLVLVVTDCVADAWYDGRFIEMLARWSRAAPVAIVQVLPQRLWGRTGLGYATPVRLRAPARAATNAHLTGAQAPAWLTEDDEAAPFLAPVATLDPASVLQLARMVGGPSTEATTGFAFDVEAMRDAGPPPPPREMPAAERVRRFWSVASSPARRLASAFAASPFLDLRVLRLLRRELIPDGSHLHEAEVVLGGIVRRTDDGGDDVAFEFTGGVRPLLLDNVATDDALRVLRRAAELAANEHPDAHQFLAALADPSAVTTPLSREAGSFAGRVAGFLEWLGGPYARMVEEAPAAPATVSGGDAPTATRLPARYGHLDPADGPPFIDREPTLRALADWWNATDSPHVLAIHGERGSGRSSLARAFLGRLKASEPPNGILVVDAAQLGSGEAVRGEIARYFATEEPAQQQASVPFEARLPVTLQGRHLIVLDDYDALEEANQPGWIESVRSALGAAGVDVRFLVIVGNTFSRPSDWAAVGTGTFDAEGGTMLLRHLGVEADESLLQHLAILGRGLPERLVRIAALMARGGAVAERLVATARGEHLPEDVDAFLDGLERPAQPRVFFYLSYARTDLDDALRSFFNDLRERVRQLTGEDAVAFPDAQSIRPGDVWEDASSEALQTCRVFVPVCTPAYFASEWAGREWGLFARRVDAFARQTDGMPPPSIVPVLWAPAAALTPAPPAIRELVVDRADIPEALKETGIRGLVRADSRALEEVVGELARRIVVVGNMYELPRAAFGPDEPAPNAFAAAQQESPEQAAESRFRAIVREMENAEPERALDIAFKGAKEADSDRRFDRSAILLALRASLLFRLERLEEARNDLGGAAARARDMREPELRAAALLAVGRTATEMGDLNEARYTLEDAFETQQRVSNWEGAAGALELLSRVLVHAGDRRGAIDRLRTAADLRQRTGDTIGRANALLRAALVALAGEGPGRDAVPLLDEAVRTLAAADIPAEHASLERALRAVARRRPSAAVPHIVIFAHAHDAEWGERMAGALIVYANLEAIRLQDLTGFGTDGRNWRPGTADRLDEADLVLLLVSQTLLGDQRSLAIAEGLATPASPGRIVPVLLKRVDVKAFGWLARIQIVPGPDQPLAHEEPDARSRLVADLAARCVELAVEERDRHDTMA